MTLAAWIFMAFVWTTVFSLLAFCYYRILTSRRLLQQDSEEKPSSTRGGSSHGST